MVKISKTKHVTKHGVVKKNPIRKSIQTMDGPAYFIKTEVEDKYGCWNDNYTISSGYYVIHDGKKHHVYKIDIGNDAMITEVSAYLTKVAMDMGEEPMFKIFKEGNKIVLSTDGFLCTDVADPSRSEMPYIIQEAAREFGAKMKPYDIWQYRTQLNKILKKYGYEAENYDSCMLHIYKVNQ